MISAARDTQASKGLRVLPSVPYWGLSPPCYYSYFSEGCAMVTKGEKQASICDCVFLSKTECCKVKTWKGNEPKGRNLCRRRKKEERSALTGGGACCCCRRMPCADGQKQKQGPSDDVDAPQLVGVMGLYCRSIVILDCAVETMIRIVRCAGRADFARSVAALQEKFPARIARCLFFSVTPSHCPAHKSNNRPTINT